MTLRKLVVGEAFRPSADFHNRAIDTIRAVESAGADRTDRLPGYSPRTVLWGNPTTDLERYSAVELGGTVGGQYSTGGAINYGYFDSPVVDVSAPTGTTVQRKVGIIQNVAQANRPAQVITHGPTFCLLDTSFTFPAGYTWEDFPYVKFETAYATPVEHGVHRILSIPADETASEKPAVLYVDLCCPPDVSIVYFELSVALKDAQATGTATVHTDSPTLKSGSTITLQNPPSRDGGGYRFEGAIGAEGQAIIQGEDIIIHNMDCPVT